MATSKTVGGLDGFKEKLKNGVYKDAKAAAKGIGGLMRFKKLKPLEETEAKRLVDEHFAGQVAPLPKKPGKATKAAAIAASVAEPTHTPSLPPQVLPISQVDLPQLNSDGVTPEQFDRVKDLIAMNTALVDGMIKTKNADPGTDISDVATIAANFEKLTRFVEQYQNYALPIFTSAIPKARTPVAAGIPQQPAPVDKAPESTPAPESPKNIPAAFMKPPTEAERRAFQSTMPPPRN